MPPDLPSIAEKPSSSEGPSYRTINKSKVPSSPSEGPCSRTINKSKVPSSPRRPVREARQAGNYSFRPRGAFTSNKIADLSINAQNTPARFAHAHGTSGRTASHVITSPPSTASGSGHVVQDKDVTSELGVDVSEHVSHRERTLTRYGNGHARNSVCSPEGKVMPRRVLIDVEHYEHFARKNGRSFPPSMSVNASTSQSQEKRHQGKTDVHSRKLVSLVYPTFNKPTKHGGRNLHVFPKHPGQQTDRSLNVTGEKTGVNGSRITNTVRTNNTESKYHPCSPDGATNRFSHSLDGTGGNPMDSSEPIRLRLYSNDKGIQSPTTDDSGGVALPVIPPLLNTNTMHWYITCSSLYPACCVQVVNEDAISALMSEDVDVTTMYQQEHRAGTYNHQYTASHTQDSSLRHVVDGWSYSQTPQWSVYIRPVDRLVMWFSLAVDWGLLSSHQSGSGSIWSPVNCKTQAGEDIYEWYQLPCWCIYLNMCTYISSRYLCSLNALCISIANVHVHFIMSFVYVLLSRDYLPEGHRWTMYRKISRIYLSSWPLSIFILFKII